MRGDDTTPVRCVPRPHRRTAAVLLTPTWRAAGMTIVSDDFSLVVVEGVDKATRRWAS